MYSKRVPQSPPISRGRACNNCKRRKMRCDGEKPICGPCSKLESLRDCEYADVGHTSADRLQEQISLLEMRIEELQNPGSRRNSLTLQNPYPASGSSSRTENRGRGSPRAQEIHLMEAFLPHAFQLGFFLDGPKLIQAFSNYDSDPNEKPTSALSAAMVLLGSVFQRDPQVPSLQEVYAPRAVQAVALGLSENHPQRILHTLQANVLIAHYFFLHARALEGKWHLNNATSLILSARMHRIRSFQGSDTQGPAMNLQATMLLPSARNVVEEGQRINAMWTVFGLNCLWSAVEGAPTLLSANTEHGRIDTPWPLDAGTYSEITFPQDLRNSHTLQKFLADIPNLSEGGSILALYVKATVLFEQTTVFWNRYSSSDARDSNQQEFSSTYQNLFTLITRLISNIPAIGPMFSNEMNKRLLVIHVLARTTMIRLHCSFGRCDPSFLQLFQDTAEDIMNCLAAVNLDSTTFLDPVMAVMFRGPAEVFLSAIRLFRSGQTYDLSKVQRNIEHLNRLIGIMARLADGNPLMTLKLAEIQGEYTRAAEN